MGLVAGVTFAAIWIGISLNIGDKERQPPVGSGDQTRSSRQGHRPPPNVDPAVESFRQSRALSHHSLARLLDSLPERLTVTDVSALIEWLLEEPNLESVSDGEHAHLANEVITLLRKQDPLPVELAETLMRLVESESHPSIIRDYALQHLRPLWSSLKHEDPNKAKIEESLWDASESEHPTRSGTAFLALHQLGYREGIIEKGNRAISDERIAELVRKSLDDQACPISMKMTALRVIEDRKLDSELGQVRELVQQEQLAFPARLKAIAVIASLGNSSDRELLASLATEKKFQPALRRAFKLLPQ